MIWDSIIKLFLALLLGGIVGFERENKIRPAGLRTHILVCIGAALVQIISINYYSGQGITGFDPMRLGAQVISGIGFLGAGTILKEGASIKGLTTAASIWSVACIGLAVGTGLYAEAAIATVFIYVALGFFKSIENKISGGRRFTEAVIITQNIPGMLGEVGSALGRLNISITGVGLEAKDDELVQISMCLKKPYEMANERILEELMLVKGIRDVKFY